PALDKDDQPTDRTRVYLGADGVMVPLVTDAEKQKRRQKHKAKRQRRGKKSKPLPRAREGADLPYKEFKIVTLYDDRGEHRLVSVTGGDCEKAIGAVEIAHDEPLSLSRSANVLPDPASRSSSGAGVHRSPCCFWN